MSHPRRVIEYLHKRELGVKTFYRFNLQILKHIIAQKDSCYKKIWKCNSLKLFFYECRKLYFDNYRTCFTVLGFDHTPQKLYKLSTVPRFKDVLCCEAPGNLPSYDETNLSCFLALTCNNWLYQLNLETGATLGKIYLSPCYKFRQMSYESYGYTVVLKSILNVSRQSDQRSNVCGDVLCAFLFFGLFPIQFIGMVELLRSVFGKDIINAIVMDELLMVCHQPGLVRLYSLQEILQNCLEFEVKLGAQCGHSRNEIVGEFPFGFPINIQIQVRPPILYEVKCCNNDLQIGGFPWQYIIQPNRNCPNKFEVFTLDPPHKITNGLMEYDTSHIEPDHVIFHPDNSGRIVHYSSTTFRCLAVKMKNETSPILELLFTLSLDTKKTEPVNIKTSTRSGRLVRRNDRYLESNAEAFQHSVIGMHYESELDIISLLIANASNNSCHQTDGYANLYDNQTGNLIKKIQLEEEWEEDSEHKLILDCDILIHIVKNFRSLSTCYVYSLV